MCLITSDMHRRFRSRPPRTLHTGRGCVLHGAVATTPWCISEEIRVTLFVYGRNNKQDLNLHCHPEHQLLEGNRTHPGRVFTVKLLSSCRRLQIHYLPQTKRVRMKLAGNHLYANPLAESGFSSDFDPLASGHVPAELARYRPSTVFLPFTQPTKKCQLSFSSRSLKDCRLGT
jgi:hypothetical protein